MGERVLVWDIGTERVKAVVVDLEAGPQAGTAAPLPVSVPEGGPDLAREVVPEALWGLLLSLSRQALGEAGPVRALAVTGQRQGFTLLDRRGRELYLGPNLDLRAVFEGTRLDEEQGDQVYRTTGHLPSFFLAPAKLLWFREHRSDVLREVLCLLTLPDWAAFRLTGEQGGEEVLLGEAGLLEVEGRRPAGAFLSSLGLDGRWLPSLCPAGQVRGGLLAGPAEALGLPTGLPVVVGGPDTQSALLGLGVAEPGEVGMVTGWSGAVQMVVDRPLWDRDRRTWAGLFPLPGRWVVEASTGDIGGAYRWARDLVTGPEAPFEQMEALASAAPPGAEGVVAFLGPRALNLSRPQAGWGGLLFPTPVTFTKVGREHLVRAVVEGLAFALRQAVDLLEEVTGMAPRRVALGGGMGRGLLPRLVAGALGREVEASTTPWTSALGSALVAGTALGYFPSLEEAVRRARGWVRTVSAPALESAQVQEAYRRWVRALRVLEGLY